MGVESKFEKSRRTWVSAFNGFVPNTALGFDSSSLPMFLVGEMLRKGKTLEEALSSKQFTAERAEAVQKVTAMLSVDNQAQITEKKAQIAQFFYDLYGTISSKMNELEKNNMDAIRGANESTPEGVLYYDYYKLLTELIQGRARVSGALPILAEQDQKIAKHQKLVSLLIEARESYAKTEEIRQKDNWKFTNPEVISAVTDQLANTIAIDMAGNRVKKLLQENNNTPTNEIDSTLKESGYYAQHLSKDIKDHALTEFTKKVSGFDYWQQRAFFTLAQTGKLAEKFDYEELEGQNPKLNKFPSQEELQAVVDETAKKMQTESETNELLAELAKYPVAEKNAKLHAGYIERLLSPVLPNEGQDEYEKIFLNQYSELQKRTNFEKPQGVTYSNEEIALLTFILDSNPSDAEINEMAKLGEKLASRTSEEDRKNHLKDVSMRQLEIATARHGGEDALVTSFAYYRDRMQTLLQEVARGNNDAFYKTIGENLKALISSIHGSETISLDNTDPIARRAALDKIYEMLEKPAHAALRTAIVGEGKPVSAEDYRKMVANHKFLDVYTKYADAMEKVQGYVKKLSEGSLEEGANVNLTDAFATIKAAKMVFLKINMERYPLKAKHDEEATAFATADMANVPMLPIKRNEINARDSIVFPTEKCLIDEQLFEHTKQAFLDSEEIKKYSKNPSLADIQKLNLTKILSSEAKKDETEVARIIEIKSGRSEDLEALLKCAASVLAKVKGTFLSELKPIQDFESGIAKMQEFYSGDKLLDANGFLKEFDAQAEKDYVKTTKDLVNFAEKLEKELPTDAIREDSDFKKNNDVVALANLRKLLTCVKDNFSVPQTGYVVNALSKNNLETQQSLFDSIADNCYSWCDDEKAFEYMQLADMLKDLSDNATALMEHPKASGYTAAYIANIQSYQKRMEIASTLVEKCQKKEELLLKYKLVNDADHKLRKDTLDRLTEQLDHFKTGIARANEYGYENEIKRVTKASEGMKENLSKAVDDLNKYRKLLLDEKQQQGANYSQDEKNTLKQNAKAGLKTLILDERVRVEKQVISRSEEVKNDAYAKKIKSAVFGDLIAGSQNSIQDALGKMEQISVVKEEDLSLENIDRFLGYNHKAELNQLLNARIGEALEPQHNVANHIAMV